MTPSQWHKAILNNKKRLQDAPEPVKSWFKFTLYKFACKILALPFDKRLTTLNSCPESFRDEIKTEVTRLNALRKR